jgi:hypothetical protein
VFVCVCVYIYIYIFSSRVALLSQLSVSKTHRFIIFPPLSSFPKKTPARAGWIASRGSSVDWLESVHRCMFCIKVRLVNTNLIAQTEDAKKKGNHTIFVRRTRMVQGDTPSVIRTGLYRWLEEPSVNSDGHNRLCGWPSRSALP